MLSVPGDGQRRSRAASMDYELGMRRSGHMRSLGARSALSVGDPTRVVSSPLVYPHAGAGTSGSRLISVQDAVYGVAIAEEEDAAEDAREKEAEEEEQAQQPKSWFTAWMFRGT